MSEDPLLADTLGALGAIFKDTAAKTFYCIALCPPLGRLRLDIQTDAFADDIDLFRDRAGVLLLRQDEQYVPQKAAETLEMLNTLSPQWKTIWPKIYQAFLQVRTDYGYTTKITRENSSFALTPPNGDSDNWGCEVELVPWDGYYVVEFNTVGEVVDAVAMF